jgi:hypothetical protein
MISQQHEPNLNKPRTALSTASFKQQVLVDLNRRLLELPPQKN